MMDGSWRPRGKTPRQHDPCDSDRATMDGSQNGQRAICLAVNPLKTVVVPLADLDAAGAAALIAAQPILSGASVRQHVVYLGEMYIMQCKLWDANGNC